MYTLYALGNALVDNEITLSSDELAKVGLSKGHMSLIDEEEFNALYAQFKSKIIKKSSGGSAANTVIGATHLACKTYFSCQVADDEQGHFYQKDLTQHHVQHNIQASQHGQTGNCMVFITEDGERSMASYLGVSSTISPDNIDPNALQQSEWAYIEGYLVSSPTGASAAKTFKKMAESKQVKTAVTLSDVSMITYFRSEFNDLLQTPVDLLFCNEEEALAFSETQTLDQAIPLLEKVAHQSVITLGKNGALIIKNGQQEKVDGCKSTLLDTNGAGDLFAGIFLASISKGHPAKMAAEAANFAAAKLVSQYGARLNDNNIKDVQHYFNTQQQVVS